MLHGGPVVAARVGRMGSRRPGRPARSDGTAAAELPSPGLAQSAHRHRRLRAAHAGTPGGAAVRGRLPARADADEPRRPCGTPELARRHAVGATADGYLRLLHVQRTAGARLGRADDPGRHRVVHPRLRSVRARWRGSLPRAADRGAGGDDGHVRCAGYPVGQGPADVLSPDGRRPGPRWVRQRDIGHRAASGRRHDDRGRARNRPGGRRHRPRRSAAHGQRVEDDARPVLRLPASRRL